MSVDRTVTERDYFGAPLPEPGTAHDVIYRTWQYGNSNKNSLEIAHALAAAGLLRDDRDQAVLDAAEAVVEAMESDDEHDLPFALLNLVTAVDARRETPT